MIANQVKRYIKETLDRDLNGYEVIKIKKRTLFDIEHINIKNYDLSFNKTDLSSLNIDFSAIKSLSM